MTLPQEGPVTTLPFINWVQTTQVRYQGVPKMKKTFCWGKLQNLYNNKEYVVSLKPDHPLVIKADRAIQEIEDRLNDIYENRTVKPISGSITDPISIQKQRFRRRERRARIAQWEEQVDPNQTTRNPERGNDCREDDIN